MCIFAYDGCFKENVMKIPMRWARTSTALVTAALLAVGSLTVGSLTACGGGGTTPSDPGDPGDPMSRQAITQILQDCGQAGITELTELFRIMEPLLAPETLPGAPGFTITSFNLANATISWSLDVEDDGTVEMTGTLGFRTAADAPYIPANFITIIPGLGGDIANLPNVLALLPDGTILRMSYVATSTFTTTGAMDLTFENPSGTGAVPTTTSGTAAVDQGDCDTRFTWTDVNAGDLLGNYPNTAIDMVATTPADAVNGNIVFNGTADATINTTLQSNGAQQQYLYNLDSGVLTPVN